VAEGEGFEPPDLSVNDFQDRRLKPLGHPSDTKMLTHPGGRSQAGFRHCLLSCRSSATIVSVFTGDGWGTA
jgi:hypothetical protein